MLAKTYIWAVDNLSLIIELLRIYNYYIDSEVFLADIVDLADSWDFFLIFDCFGNRLEHKI